MAVATQVTIEDLSSLPEPAPAKPRDELVSLDPRQSAPAPVVAAPSAISPASTPVATSDLDGELALEALTDLLGYDVATSEQLIATEQARLDKLLNTITLHKDDFVPGLTKILDALAHPDPAYQAVVAGLANFDDAAADPSVALLAARLRSAATATAQATAQLESRVDQLLDTFPLGNNWYRLLAAWQLLSQADYESLVARHDWQFKLADLALLLYGEAGKKQLRADAAAGTDLETSLLTYFYQLEKSGLVLTSDQKDQLTRFLLPILANYQLQAHHPAPTPNQLPVAAEAKFSQLADQLTALTTKVDHDQTNKISDISVKVEDLNKNFTQMARAQADHTTKLKAVSDGVRDLTKKTDILRADLGKLPAQFEAKLEKEKQGLTGKNQLLRDQLVKTQQDLKLKISSVEEGLASYKKAQTQRDEDQTKKITDFSGRIDQNATKLTAQLESYDEQMSKTRRDLEDRLHQFSRQVSEIKTDQIRIDQVQTAALSQLTAKAQLNQTTIEGLRDQLADQDKQHQQWQADQADLRLQLDQLTRQLTDRTAKIEELTSQFSQQLQDQQTKLDKMAEQIGSLHAYATKLETENEELRIANAGLKQENWQARRQADLAGEPAAGWGPAQPAPSPTSIASVNSDPFAAPLPETVVPAPAPIYPATPASSEVYPVMTPPAAPTPADQPVVPDLAAPVMPIPESIPTNLEKLGLQRRVAPDSPLLTGQNLGFEGLNDQLSTALVGHNVSPVASTGPIVSAPVAPADPYHVLTSQPDPVSVPDLSIPVPEPTLVYQSSAPVNTAPVDYPTDSLPAATPVSPLDNLPIDQPSSETVILPFLGS